MKLILQHSTSPKNQIVEVANEVEAQKAFCAWRDSNGFGGGNMTRKSGELFDGKTLIGNFSYNGRFWGNDGKEIIVGKPTDDQHLESALKTIRAARS